MGELQTSFAQLSQKVAQGDALLNFLNLFTLIVLLLMQSLKFRPHYGAPVNCTGAIQLLVLLVLLQELKLLPFLSIRANFPFVGVGVAVLCPTAPGSSLLGVSRRFAFLDSPTRALFFLEARPW
jgi:hypothetical protein